MNDETFIHLCQPDGCKSCGACCGLYNYADSSKESLVKRLRRRSSLFREKVERQEDLPAYAQEVLSSEDQTKRYEVIYCCEYLGFIDEHERRVGCLLHPVQNGGRDMRDVSFYGRELCDGHFCPSYHYISRDEKTALLHILDDWYLYGLCVTDIDLVKEYFRLISEAVSEMPHPGRFAEGGLRQIAARFFSLKLSWPFRSPDVNRFGKYYFDGSQYMINHIDYHSLGCERSRFDRIFLSLSSDFKTSEEIRHAERLVQSHIDDFAAAYAAPLS